MTGIYEGAELQVAYFETEAAWDTFTIDSGAFIPDEYSGTHPDQYNHGKSLQGKKVGPAAVGGTKVAQLKWKVTPTWGRKPKGFKVCWAPMPMPPPPMPPQPPMPPPPSPPPSPTTPPPSPEDDEEEDETATEDDGEEDEPEVM